AVAVADRLVSDTVSLGLFVDLCRVLPAIGDEESIVDSRTHRMLVRMVFFFCFVSAFFRRYLHRPMARIIICAFFKILFFELLDTKK
ncbi:hypothetical protein L9F63_006714, partial [Diploptera punctata]